MGLLDDLEPPTKKRICIVGRILEELDESDRETLQNALANDKWSTNALAKALNNRGLKLNRNSLHEHRTKACSCWRT